MSQNNKNEVSLNIKRLQRHFDVCIKDYDEISLRDFAHALRNCMDLKNVINEVINENGYSNEFITPKCNDELKDLLKGKEHVIASFEPNGLATTGGTLFEITAIIGYALKPTEHKIFINAFSKSKKNFLDWLNSEAVRICNKSISETNIIFTREKLVRRVANILGGSHPNIKKENLKSVDDQYVNYLMGYQFRNSPAPYFILLKIADDILNWGKENDLIH